MPAGFQHEYVAAVPRGYRVRTTPSGEHLIRVAYPKGPRRRGAGQLVEILHPVGENPLCAIRNIADPTKLERQRAARERAARIRAARLNPDRYEVVEITPSDQAHPMYHDLTQAEARERLAELRKRTEGSGWRYIMRRQKTRAANQSNVYSKAVSLGFPYLRGEGKIAADGRTWLSRATKTADGTGPAIFVGWDQQKRKWIVERENPSMDAFAREHLKKWLASSVASDERRSVGKLIRDYVKRYPEVLTEMPSRSWPEIRRMAESNPRPRDPRDYAYAIVYKHPESGKTQRVGSYTHRDAERIAEEFRQRLKKQYGRYVHVEVQPEKESLLSRVGRLLPMLPNPDERELREAGRLYEEFHGRAPHEILEIQQQAEQRGEYTALGTLVELTIEGSKGDVKVAFPGDVRLASSPEGTQLYLIGGDQDVSNGLADFGVDDSKDLIDLGAAKQIVYEASKWQTEFTPQEWKHKFGEETGAQPRVLFDRLNARLAFAGGNYRVERPGIVD